jgi:DNA repair exonuclease SbcCD ATPase subunit
MIGSGSRLPPERPRTERQSPTLRSRRDHSDHSQGEPPAKRPRKASPYAEPTPSGTFYIHLPIFHPTNPQLGSNQASSSKHASNSEPAASHTTSPVPASTEWMRARIERLESELSASNASRDLAISEQAIAVISHQTERQARREALSQKSTVEAALSRAEAEQARLLAELEKPQQRGAPEEMDRLRGQLEAVEAKLSEIGQSAGEREARIKKLELELEETQDEAHKLRIQKAQLEQSETEPGPLLQETREEVERLTTELAEAQEQLECTHQALEKAHLKYSNERSKHKVTKEKLADYKTRFQDNSTISEQLRDTAPAAFETLKAVMCAMGLPPIQDQDQVLTPKTETE